MTALVDVGFLVNKISRSHSVLDTTCHRALRTSDWPIIETSTWQHTTITRDRHPCP